MRIVPVRSALNRAETVLGYVAVVLLVFGARLWFISKFGGPMPVYDQWDGEASELFKPFLEGKLHFSDLFTPHNEHRIVLSRLLALGLLELNGQWDSLLETAVNALIGALTAAVVAATLIRSFDGRNRTFILTAVAAWLALPYANENTLWGFQSSFYFLILFSWIAIWGMGFHDPFHIEWWLGAASLLLASLSIASGFFAGIVILGLLSARLLARGASLRECGAAALFSLVLIAVSLQFRVAVPGHDILKATSFISWLTFLGKCLSWPFCNTPFVCLLIYAPLGTLGVIYWFSRLGVEESLSKRIEFLGSVGAWSVLQAAAIAYARGGDSSALVSSRDMDILALGTLANLLALVVLLGYARRHFTRQSVSIAAAVTWIVVVASGAAQTSRIAIGATTYRQTYLHDCEKAIQAYLVTGDVDHIAKDSKTFLPYPWLDYLIPILNDSAIRSILPAAARVPLRIEKSQDIGHAFVPGEYPPKLTAPAYERGWGSYSGRGDATRGMMRSQEIAPRLPYLRFQMAGYFSNAMSIRLVGEQNGKVTRIHVPGRGDGSWRDAYAAVPDTRVRLVAEDNDSTHWFAFLEPEELGRYSFYTLRLLRQSKWIFLGGVALWLVLIAFTTFSVSLLFARRLTSSLVPIRGIFQAKGLDQIDGHSRVPRR